jgi:DNA processing protein
MMDCDEPSAWAVLARCPGLDAARLSFVLERLEGPRGILTASGRERARGGLPPVSCAYLAGPGGTPRPIERRWLEGERHHLISFRDPRFPHLLAALPGAPVALYVRGNVAALAEPQVAIVGSRNPTPQGRETAFDFAQYLALRGLGIASGLAEGIDGAAHRGALKAQGITLGVLGTGIDQVYPRCHRSLFDEIADSGALVSEFPLETPARRGNFPRRNRIIAGVSLGTLVVEAARHSGSLITARLAGEHGREVFAVPGSIHSPLSGGCHELLKAGAKLVESGDDILRELNFSAFFSNDFRPAEARPALPSPAAGMDKAHKILLDALGFGPVDLDTVVVRTGYKAEAVSSMMLILELEGHVQTAPGGRYSRVVNRSAGGER